MPVVPGRPNLISTDVPSMSSGAEYAGSVNRAISGLGQQVSNVAMDIADKLQGFENNNAVLRSQTDFKLFDKDLMTEISGDRFSDGYVKVQGYDPNEKDPLKLYEYVNDPKSIGGKKKKTVTEYYTEAATNKIKELSAGMPTYVAQQQANQVLGSEMNSGITSAWSIEQKAKLTAFTGALNSDSQKTNDMFIATPVPVGAKMDWYEVHDNYVARIQSGVNHSLLTPADGTSNKNSVLSKGAESEVDGLIHQLTNGIRDARFKLKLNPDDPTAIVDVETEKKKILSVLDGTDPASMARKKAGKYTLAESLTEAQQDTLRTRLGSISAADKKEGLNELRLWWSNVKAGLQSGRIKDDPTLKIQQLIIKATPHLNAGDFSPSELATMAAEAFSSKALGILDSIEFKTGTLPRKQAFESAAIRDVTRSMAKMRELFKNTPSMQNYGEEVGNKAILDVKEGFRKELANQTSALRQDAPAAINTWGTNIPNSLGSMRDTWNTSDVKTLIKPEFVRYIHGMDSTLKRTNASRDNLMDNKAASEFVTTITDITKNPMDSVTTFKSLYNIEKNHWTYNKVMKQLIASGLPPEYALLRNMNDSLAQNFQAIHQDKDGNFVKNYKASISPDEAAKLDHEVYPEFKRYTEALATEAPNSALRAKIRTSLDDFFRKMVILNMTSNTGSKSRQEAASEIYKAMVGNDNHVFQLTTKEKSKSYFVQVPKVLPDGSVIEEGDRSAIQTFINQGMTADFMKSNGLKPPPDWSKQDVSVDRFYEGVSGRATIAPDPSITGMWNVTLPSEYGGGTPQQVYVGDKPLRLPLQEIKYLGKIQDNKKFLNELKRAIKKYNVSVPDFEGP